MSVLEYNFLNYDQNSNGTNSTKSLESVETWVNRNMTAVIVACATGFFILLLVITILLICRQRRRKRRSFDFLLEDPTDTNAVYNSEPVPRSTPKLTKRKSCPDAYGSTRGVQSSSATVEKIRKTADRVEGMKQKSFSIPYMQNQSSSLGTLRPEIYSSNTEGKEDGHLPPSQNGRIWFSMFYDATSEQLTVNLIKINELHEREKGNAPRDPFVKIFLSPDERTCRTSKVVKRTLSPVFNQTFYFQVPSVEIASRSIRFSVYDVDKRRVRHSLGHVFIPLKNFDLIRGDICCRDLEETIQSSAPLGDLHIGLTYLPNVDQIKILVLSAKNLRDLESDQGYYVKLNFRYGRKTVKSKKTMIRRTHGQEITFNESFTFSFSGRQLNHCNFIVSLRKAGRGCQGRGGEYGFISFGSFMFVHGEDLLHWQDMLAQPRMTIRKWHRLSFCPAKR